MVQKEPDSLGSGDLNMEVTASGVLVIRVSPEQERILTTPVNDLNPNQVGWRGRWFTNLQLTTRRRFHQTGLPIEIKIQVED